MGAKGGHAAKDAPILDGFNKKKKGGLTKKELNTLAREARLNKIRLESEKKATEASLLKMGVKSSGEDESGKDDIGALSEEEEKSAYKTLQDLRWAYQNAKGKDGKKGRQRLLELMETDVDFKYMVKELMRIEVSLMASKLKSKDPGGDNEDKTVFVVLKGLEEEKKFAEKFDTDEGAADLKQISHALNPDGTDYKEDTDDW